MSVYAKDRKTTKLQYIVTAQKLQVAVIQYLMNDNHVPKKMALYVGSRRYFKS